MNHPCGVWKWVERMIQPRIQREAVSTGHPGRRSLAIEMRVLRVGGQGVPIFPVTRFLSDGYTPETPPLWAIWVARGRFLAGLRGLVRCWTRAGATAKPGYVLLHCAPFVDNSAQSATDGMTALLWRSNLRALAGYFGPVMPGLPVLHRSMELPFPKRPLAAMARANHIDQRSCGRNRRRRAQFQQRIGPVGQHKQESRHR